MQYKQETYSLILQAGLQDPTKCLKKSAASTARSWFPWMNLLQHLMNSDLG